jgi:hypothetical protein
MWRRRDTTNAGTDPADFSADDHFSADAHADDHADVQPDGSSDPRANA